MAIKKNGSTPKPLSFSDKVWSELTGVLLVLLAIYLVAAMASFNAGAARNLGGVAGQRHQFGFLRFAGPDRLCSAAAADCRRRQSDTAGDDKAHVGSLLTIIVFWLWLDIGLGYLRDDPDPCGNCGTPLAGSVGRGSGQRRWLASSVMRAQSSF